MQPRARQVRPASQLWPARLCLAGSRSRTQRSWQTNDIRARPAPRAARLPFAVMSSRAMRNRTGLAHDADRFGRGHCTAAWLGAKASRPAARDCRSSRSGAAGAATPASSLPARTLHARQHQWLNRLGQPPARPAAANAGRWPVRRARSPSDPKARTTGRRPVEDRPAEFYTEANRALTGVGHARRGSGGGGGGAPTRCTSCVQRARVRAIPRMWRRGDPQVASCRPTHAEFRAGSRSPFTEPCGSRFPWISRAQACGRAARSLIT